MFPFFAPAYRTQMAFLWVMIVFALTWDLLGGQMGYNSFGNVLFFLIAVLMQARLRRRARLRLQSTE